MAANAIRTWKRAAAGACVLAPVLVAALLSACQKPQPTVLPAPPPVVHGPAQAPSLIPTERRPAASLTLDEYKAQVARQIMAANPKVIFSGRLPEMMTAIVVLDIGIGRDGEVSSVKVHRSPNSQASEIAVDAVKLGGPYPQPGKLLGMMHRTLTFSETFLFNRDYQFQLRTLAGPQ
jgi:protein TonB